MQLPETKVHTFIYWKYIDFSNETFLGFLQQETDKQRTFLNENGLHSFTHSVKEDICWKTTQVLFPLNFQINHDKKTNMSFTKKKFLKLTTVSYIKK